MCGEGSLLIRLESADYAYLLPKHHLILPPILQSPRLLLRPFTVDDIEASWQMNLDEAVSRYTGDGGVVSREELERRIKEDVLGDYQRVGYGRMAVVLKETGIFIGFAGLKYLEDLGETDLGYRLMSTHWGQGYATEACRAILEDGFPRWKLESVIALVLPENVGSVRVLDKLGFEREGEVLEEGLMACQYRLGRRSFEGIRESRYRGE